MKCINRFNVILTGRLPFPENFRNFWRHSAFHSAEHLFHIVVNDVSLSDGPLTLVEAAEFLKIPVALSVTCASASASVMRG
jgi:hypothetical protein